MPIVENNIPIGVNESLSTSYSFTVTNNKFETDFKFKFNDTIISIYNEIIENKNNIKLKSNRSTRYVS